MDVTRNQAGVFASYAEGDAIPGTAYKLSYLFNATSGANDVGLLQNVVIPERSSLLLAGLGVVSMCVLRRQG